MHFWQTRQHNVLDCRMHNLIKTCAKCKKFVHQMQTLYKPFWSQRTGHPLWFACNEIYAEYIHEYVMNDWVREKEGEAFKIIGKMHKWDVNFLFPEAGILFPHGILVETSEVSKQCDRPNCCRIYKRLLHNDAQHLLMYYHLKRSSSCTIYILWY